MVSVAASCRIAVCVVSPTFNFLLIGVERLAREVDGGLCRLHCDAVLLHVKLRIAHLDPHLIFQLQFAHLRLPVFQFGAHLVRLRLPVAKGNAEGQPDAFVGRG